MIKYLLLLVLSIPTFFNLKAQKNTSWYFPEYKHYYRPVGNCNQSAIRSIWGWQYLKIKVYDSCRKVEVSCYRSKDSTLIERGIYLNPNEVVYAKATSVNDNGKQVVELPIITFKRTGTWKFYDRTGKLTKTKLYK